MIDVLYTSLTGFPTANEGGGNRIIYELIKNLDTDRFSSEYVSFTYQKKFEKDEQLLNPLLDLSPRKKLGRTFYQNIPLYKMVVTSPLYFRFYFNRIDRFFERYALQLHSDVIHAHHPLVLPYFRNSKTKKILTIHSKGGFAHESKGKGFKRHFYKEHFQSLEELERTAVRTADCITFPSKAAKELFFRVNGIECSEEKVRIIYNSVDLDYINSIVADENIFQQYNIRENASLYILNVAEHALQKNIPMLIKAVEILAKEQSKDIIMINIGKGEDTDMLQRMVRELELTKNIYFLGAIPNNNVIKFMKKCECFVLTSTNVIFDLVVLEALACGMAIFVSDDGGNREVIKNGENGYLLNQIDVASVAEAVMKYDKAIIRANARQSVQRYSLQTMSQEYMKLYKDLVYR